LYGFLFELFRRIGFNEVTAIVFSYVVIFTLIAIMCYLAHVMGESIVKKLANRDLLKSKHKWFNVSLKHNVFHHTANMLIPVTITIFANALPGINIVVQGFLMKTAGVIAAFLSPFLINALINTVDEIYRQKKISKSKPLHGLFQILKIVTFIICIIAGITVLMGKNPITLIGGIGAMTAVLTLIFKDVIIGFTAGLVLINEDLIRIGDWIEVPKHNANGYVTELSVTTVKVENFDKTFTSIPAYSLISDSFINWRGMTDSGGRRIKRAIHIDLRDVRFCDEEMLSKFEQIEILKDYIINRQAEIDRHNKEKGVDTSCVVNGRRMTNIGVFRAYIQSYIEHHPRLQKDMTIAARQLASDRYGIPLEVIAFANTVEFAEYEKIQSDIFDHLYAVAKEFGLRVYQCQITQNE